MTASRTPYDHFASHEANFVVALPAGRFRIFEHSDAGDLTLIGAADPSCDRIDLEFFAGAASEEALAERFAAKRVRSAQRGEREAGAAVALPNTGDSIGSLVLPTMGSDGHGFVAARPWFGGIVTCGASLDRTAPDAAALVAAVREAWTWLRRMR